jgi:hypothetical protein
VLLFTCAGAACTDDPALPEVEDCPGDPKGLKAKLRSTIVGRHPVPRNPAQERLILQSTSACNLWPGKRQHTLRCQIACELFKKKAQTAILSLDRLERGGRRQASSALRARMRKK